MRNRDIPCLPRMMLDRSAITAVDAAIFQPALRLLAVSVRTGRSSRRRTQTLDVEIDDIDADLRRAVTEAGPPRAGPQLRVAHIPQKEAAPLAAGRKARDAVAGELEGQRLLVPIRVTEHMRANLAIALGIAAG